MKKIFDMVGQLNYQESQEFLELSITQSFNNDILSLDKLLNSMLEKIDSNKVAIIMMALVLSTAVDLVSYSLDVDPVVYLTAILESVTEVNAEEGGIFGKN